jgi:hypothetical protein
VVRSGVLTDLSAKRSRRNEASPVVENLTSEEWNKQQTSNNSALKL